MDHKDQCVLIDVFSIKVNQNLIKQLKYKLGYKIEICTYIKYNIKEIDDMNIEYLNQIFRLF